MLELYAYKIAQNPDAINMLAIVLFIGYIIYFAFREGIRGGFIATTVTVLYYVYIIYTRRHTGDQLITSIETVLVLTFLYLFMAGIIGWLKQTIDELIEKEADEKKRLQAIIQQLPVGVIITDNKGTIVQANKQVDYILDMKVPLGFAIGKEILVQSVQDGKPNGPPQLPLIQTLASGKPVVGQEFTIHHRNGKKVYVQVSASAIHNREGNIIAAASIISDITSQKEMEERKDDFLNMASHELKTPITSMKLYIDSLMVKIGKYKDNRATAILRNINTQTSRLQKLVNDLLDVSRLQTGKLSFSKEEFRLDELIEETIEILQGSTKKQSILFVKKTPITVSADRFRVYQVLTNLLTNAIKYSGEGTKVNIRLYKQEGSAVVEIQDFGIGIAKDQQKKIFERLYQVTDDKEKTFPGFGMGLYISKEIIKRHKGAIWVESEKEKGSHFYFSLPLGKKYVS
ncbi:MAG: hypothetical protein RI947_243 [Candidatus Parcubacteria bacterium]